MSADKIILRLGLAGILIGLTPLIAAAQGKGQSQGNGKGQEVAASHRNNEEKEAKDKGQENANKHRKNILFILQDKVISFLPTGEGVQVGTATGKINGVSITNFDFDINFETGAFTFDNWAGITDPDGDQIIFNVLGAGQLVVPPLVAEGDPFPVLGSLGPPLGGPVSGTYEVRATSGKFSEKYEIGEKFPFRAVGYNPNPTAVMLPADEALGAVYVEVFSNRVHDDAEDDDGEDEGGE